jgi:hypothetical protein
MVVKKVKVDGGRILIANEQADLKAIYEDPSINVIEELHVYIEEEVESSKERVCKKVVNIKREDFSEEFAEFDLLVNGMLEELAMNYVSRNMGYSEFNANLKKTIDDLDARSLLSTMGDDARTLLESMKDKVRKLYISPEFIDGMYNEVTPELIEKFSKDWGLVDKYRGLSTELIYRYTQNRDHGKSIRNSLEFLFMTNSGMKKGEYHFFMSIIGYLFDTAIKESNDKALTGKRCINILNPSMMLKDFKGVIDKIAKLYNEYHGIIEHEDEVTPVEDVAVCDGDSCPI